VLPDRYRVTSLVLNGHPLIKEGVLMGAKR